MAVTADAVLELTSFGLYPVRLHYPIFRGDNVTCSCGNPDCKAQGKHPVASAWGKSATQDGDIIVTQWANDKWNVGIVLGCCNGIPADKAIIDIEDDSIEGLALADTILKDFPCPSYTSGKSRHRLYRWSEGYPPIANMTINGLEFRFGNGKQTQSVAPPSIHWTNAEYKWIDGMTLADIPLMELPDYLIKHLGEEWAKKESNSPGGTSTTDARKFRSPSGKLGVGARHHSLLIEANNLWRKAFILYGINGIEEQEVIDQVWMWLMGANLLVCDPPKSEAEIHTIFRSAQSHMLAIFENEISEKQAASSPAPAVNKDDRSFGAWLHRNGIRLISDPALDPNKPHPDRIDEWGCNWTLKYVTKADEDLIEMSIPSAVVSEQTGESEGCHVVVMRSADFDSSAAVSRIIQQETSGDIALGRTFPAWSFRTIWDGQHNDARRRNGITRGLKEFLIASCVVESRNSGTGGLADQVEDLVDAMSGNLDRLLRALEVWTGHGHKFFGRLKIVPGGDELTFMRIPEDPMSGYYHCEEDDAGKILLLVKLDELNHRYRRAYGGIVSSRKIVEAIESLGFQKKRFSKGVLCGRWFIKEINMQE